MAEPKNPEHEPDIEALSVGTEDRDPSTTTVNRQRMRRRKIFSYSTLALLAFGVLAPIAQTLAQGTDKGYDKAQDPTEQPTTGPTTPTTIGPNLSSIGPDYFGPICSSKKRTIKPGDTLFGLTTVGIQGDISFTNEVFGWNLNFVRDQSKKDPALVDPDNIPIGHELKIQTDCIDVYGTFPVRDYDNFVYTDSNPEPPITGYERTLTFQNYHGIDGKIHHLVTVDYDTDKQGKPTGVQSCEPAPSCFLYVAGTP